jgi:hypothetical protein
VAYWFGVSDQTVTVWRKALDVPAMTEGTTLLKSERLTPVLERARASLPNLGGAEHRAKISAAKRGKPRPRHVIEAMRQGRTGKPQDAKTRLKMSGTHKARGTRPPLAGIPWTKEEDELARTLKAKEDVQRTGRTLKAVYSRRRVLGLPDGRSSR